MQVGGTPVLANMKTLDLLFDTFLRIEAGEELMERVEEQAGRKHFTTVPLRIAL